MDPSSKTVRLLEENKGINHHELSISNGFLNMTPKAQEKID